MTKAFPNALKSENNLTYTENGALTNKSTNSATLDFFSQGGAIREQDEDRIVSMFVRAWNEDELVALRTAFYFRDVRGGQGQRRPFRIQMKYLAEIAPDVVRKNLHLIPEYGRWDDLYAFVGTDVEFDAFQLMYNQFVEDLKNAGLNKPVSLLGKWLKSENASSEETKHLARKTREFFKITPKQYRKALSTLRKHIDVVERKMSAGEWGEIEYSHVPSRAMMIYRNAFRTHDEKRFSKFIDAVNRGEAKINSSVLYPYEIVSKVLNREIRADEAQAMWDNLPNYVGKEENSIAVVDVSGSMYGVPITVSISLGLYLAERAKGPYKNHFITFSGIPELVEITGRTIKQKIDMMYKSDWGYNTDIEAVFDLILKTAIDNGISQDEMVDKLYIISDMEFDSAVSGGNETLFRTIRKKFERAGYQMPKLVFWNVNARNVQFPMTMDERGFQNVSGFSPSIFEHLMKGEFLSPHDFMLSVVNSERYQPIVV